MQEPNSSDGDTERSDELANPGFRSGLSSGQQAQRLLGAGPSSAGKNASAGDLIPASAPFTDAQREWLSGFFAGLLGVDTSPGNDTNGEGHAWQDPGLGLQQRQRLAASQPYRLRVQATLAQLDCGQCGYNCRGYAEAIAEGRETNLTLCLPGGRDTARALRTLSENRDGDAPRPGKLIQARQRVADPTSTGAPTHGRNNPWAARIKTVEPLHRGAGRDARHVIIDLDGADLRYRSGDSLGVAPQNDPDAVRAILRAVGARGQEEVQTERGRGPAWRALLEELDLSIPTPELLTTLSRAARAPEEAKQLGQLAQVDAASGPDVRGLLRRFPSARPRIDDLIAALAPLQPRLYPISSSPRVTPDEVHIAVSVQRSGDSSRKGLASPFLADRLREGEWVPIYVQPTTRFVLPEDDLAPVIMVGAGIGAVAYRAFLLDRKARGDKGRNWLFFGNRHRKGDFYFESEILDWKKSGHLTRLDCAFSRDQSDRIYVQHRMLENATQIWRWLVDGAYFYVTGDATTVVPEVEETLRSVVVNEGRMAPEKADEYLENLKAEGRYLREVY